MGADANKWPLEVPSQLIVGDPTHPVGIITLWTLRDKVAESLPRGSYGAIGQLYGGGGIDVLIRNLLANPHICVLLVHGNDAKSGSGQALKDFFCRGVERGKTSAGVETWLVKSSVEASIDLDVPLDLINRIRAETVIEWCRTRENLLARLSYFSTSRFDFLAQNAPVYIPKQRPKDAGIWPTRPTTHTITASTVARAWVQILDQVMRFGQLSQTHYDSAQKELLGLKTVVAAEDPNKFHLPDFMGLSAERVASYLPEVLDARPPEGTKYTYGWLMRGHWFDQVEGVIAKLVAEPDARSAVISLWDPMVAREGNSPCFNHLWFRLVDENSRLLLITTIRSNDMMKAWPMNAFALRKLQQLVAQAISERIDYQVGLSDLVTISDSAHIYSGDWSAAMSIVETHYDRQVKDRSDYDPRGQYRLQLWDGQLTLIHQMPELNGAGLRDFVGKTAADIQKQIVRFGLVSTTSHALYLGRELEKAERARLEPDRYEYVQDKPLILRGQ